MLSDRLAELTRAGLMERIVTDTRPPGFTYQLSPHGKDLLPVLHEHGTWADKHYPQHRC